MELKSKELFLSTLDGVMSVRQDCGLENGKAEALKDAVQNMPLLVPVVGEFSAGKSTLLNTLMGRDVLAVSIVPETAIPAELYYSETEYDEGVRAEQSTERLTNLSDAAGRYVCVKRHINSPFLRNIEPIVLVDMPGFDSPLDAHNKAIFNYLDRGIHYAVLIPADAGTVSRSMQRQIRNILSFNKTCTFFLSRTDLRSAEEVEQVKNELESQLSVITGEPVTVECISRNDVSLFSSFAHSLNADGLFRSQFNDSVLDACYDTKSSLNTCITALKADSGKNRQAVSELEEAIRKIKEKKQRLIERAGKDTFSDEAGAVADEVGKSLNSELDILVSAAKSGGSEALLEEINSIIQSAVVSKIQTVMEKISVRFGKELTGEIEGLDRILGDYADGGIVGRFQDTVQIMFDSVKSSIDSYIKERKGKDGTSDAYKTITVVLAALTDVLNPILEAVIILLPEIINFILSKMQEGRIRECIVSQIPLIKRRVREKVVEILQENSRSTITAICAKLDDELRQKKDEIEKVQKADAAEISAQIEKYSAGVKRIDDLIAKVLD
jgi:hypothetical protein